MILLTVFILLLLAITLACTAYCEMGPEWDADKWEAMIAETKATIERTNKLTKGVK